MREYRIWNKKFKQMYYSSNYNCLGDFFSSCGYSYHATDEPKDNYVVMIGVNEIFEGDIVTDSQDRKYLVVWDDQKAGLFLKVLYDTREPFLKAGAITPIDRHDLTVIGNKYEKPKLLEESGQDENV